jgi:hypothetical protein
VVPIPRDGYGIWDMTRLEKKSLLWEVKINNIQK